MADKHTVRFEPVGIEIEATEGETVLDAAFRQGVSLMHGCREGQCSACKVFVLDGEVQMDRYSTFALADYESDEGYVLMCRAHAYSDLEIELENYDEDMIRSGLPVVTVQTTVAEITELSHDISQVRLALPDYGAFTLRVSSDRRLVFVAGGAGMSALLSLLRQMADSGSDREVVYYYAARTERDLIKLDELAEIAGKLPNFTFVPCLSESWPEDWPGDGTGATGLVTKVLEAREPGLAECDVYLCGPPPMIDAALPLLESAGVPPEQVFYDKFTISAAAES